MGTFTSRQRTFSLPAVGGLASSGADVRLNSRRPLLRRDRPKFTNAQGRSPAAGLPAHAKALLHARHLPVPIDASQLASHARLSHRAAQESGRPTPRRTTSTLRAARPPTSVQAALRGPRARTISSISIPPSAGSRSRSSAAATRRKEAATTANTAGPSRGGAAPTSCRPRTPTYTTSSQPMAR